MEFSVVMFIRGVVGISIRGIKSEETGQSRGKKPSKIIQERKQGSKKIKKQNRTQL